MKNLNCFLFESYIEYQLINESNIKVFPKRGKVAKFSWWKGNHAIERQKERNITDKEVTDAIFGAYNDIKKLFSEGKLVQSINGIDSLIIIIDSRKDRENPVCVCIYLRSNYGTKKLNSPSFILKTVFKKTESNQSDFSGLIRNGSKRNGENIIYLY